ncbi:MAG: patatin-like phospholipase family protein [Rhodospirillales bacterium]|nr:patatin-like phospholipase family protein [Rhodospirillales bacterium]
MPPNVPLRGLVLGGGNALGAYHAGVYQALAEAGETPTWIAGTSIGAITAALIAGNPAERRIERLRSFWDRAAAPDWVPGLRRASQWAGALEARLLGRPDLFRPRLPLFGGPPDRMGFYDPAPLRRLLRELIDFERLHTGGIRVSVVALDLESGEEAVFDTAHSRIEVDHLLASTALIPDFPPVRVGERWLVDGGFANNTPVDVMLGAPPEPMACFVADLFPLAGPLPRDLASLGMRQSDLTFATQTARTLRLLSAQEAARTGPRVDVVPVAYGAEAEESSLKSWDFSTGTVRRRWDAGRADMTAALAAWREVPAREHGMVVHPAPGGAPRAGG